MSTTFRVLLRSDARPLTKDLNKLKTKINFCLFLVEVQQVNSKPRRRVATVTASGTQCTSSRKLQHADRQTSSENK